MILHFNKRMQFMLNKSRLIQLSRFVTEYNFFIKYYKLKNLVKNLLCVDLYKVF